VAVHADVRPSDGFVSPSSDLGPRLEQLALNLWWMWQPDVIELFRAIAADKAGQR
jgi:hypothetical protein